MSLKDEFEKGINHPDAPKMPFIVRWGPALFAVFAVLMIVVLVAVGVQ